MIDGPTLVDDALRSPIEVIEVYAESAAPDEVVAAAQALGVSVRRIADGALSQVTSPVHPQPIAAVASIPPSPDTAVLRDLVLVLVGVADPGNAGTIVRVAEAAGATAVVSCADAVDPWNPKCVRASAGSLFRVPVLDGGTFAAALDLLGEAGMTTVACDAAASVAYDSIDLTGDVAVLVGNEAHGLGDRTDVAHTTVSVPMQGDVESLNVAMTGTILAFESARQRRASASAPTVETDPSN